MAKVFPSPLPNQLNTKSQIVLPAELVKLDLERRKIVPILLQQPAGDFAAAA